MVLHILTENGMRYDFHSSDFHSPEATVRIVRDSHLVGRLKHMYPAPMAVKPGDEVFLSFIGRNIDPETFTAEHFHVNEKLSVKTVSITE